MSWLHKMWANVFIPLGSLLFPRHVHIRLLLMPILNVNSKASVQTRGLWQLAEHPCFSEQDTFSFQRQKDFQDT